MAFTFSFWASKSLLQLYHRQAKKKSLSRQLNMPVNRICEASGLSDDSGRNSVPMEKGAKVLSKENRQAYHSHETRCTPIVV